MPQSPSLHSHCFLGSHERISLPTLQNLCATGSHICLSWIVPIPLQHRNQSLGSPTQSCMQGHYWVPLFHPLLATPSWGPTLSSKANFRTSGPFLLRTCSASPSSLNALATRNVLCRLKKKLSWRSFCSLATQTFPSPRETLIMCPPFPHGLQPTSLFPHSSPLHRQ